METALGMVVLHEGEHAPVILRPTAHPDVEATLRAREPEPGPRRKHYQRQLEDFVDAARTGREPMVPLREGLESLRLIEAFYAARRPLADAAEPPARNEDAAG
jgi:predicted dehydrogenase